MLNKAGSSQARWIGIFVLVFILSLAELAALILDYQNNRYLRQYVSDNLGMIVAGSIGLLMIAGIAGYAVSRNLRVPKTLGSPPTVARIGSFVVRRHKLIIVFWILLFAASSPLSQQLSQVTTPSTSGGQSSAAKSAQAVI